jgi:DNA-binding NtrC family response regulator
MAERTEMLTLSGAVEIMERAYLKTVLDLTRGNISQAARIAGQSRMTLYRKLDKYGLAVDRPVKAGPVEPAAGPEGT